MVRRMKKILCMLIMAGVIFTQPVTVFATTDGIVTYLNGSEGTGTETSDAILSNENKPYLALGADLSEAQTDIVLTQMGITREDLVSYNVVYITNEEEHQHLDGYIDSSVIGTNALSSVMVKQTNAGSGLRVTTHNITYCTINMYRNALLTAGVQDADILVVGPSQISGTAALIGAMKAYENMSGADLNETAQTTAVEELVVTSDIINSAETEEEAGQIQEAIDYIKAEVISSDLTDLEAISDVIENAQTEYSIELTEEQKEQLAGMMQGIGELDIDPGKLIEQASDIYEKYGESALEEAKEVVDGIFTEEVKQSLWDQIKGIFSTLWNAIKDFISGANTEETATETE